MDIEREIEGFAVQIMAIRAVVAPLLAYEAARYENPDDLFRAISEGIEQMLARHTKGSAVMDLEEGVRREIDWFVAAARSIL